MNPQKVGFITGLTAELGLLKNTQFMAAAGGGTPQGAATAAQNLIAQGAEALISFGLAGGLNPALKPGTIIIPAQINNTPCDAALNLWLGGATCQNLYAGTTIAVTREQKATLFATTNADAIDLESGAVVTAAQAAQIPFACLRAIADPATRTLPPAALIALNFNGEIALGPILASLARNPLQLPALIALATDAAKARKALITKLAALTA
jgi:adenosylhomocysteine nucleosidase